MQSTTPATKSNVIVITGIGDDVWLMKLLTHHWRKRGLAVTIFRSGWDESETLTDKLDRLQQMVKRYHPVSLVGVSAGGSLAVNALALYPDLIHRAVVVGSRLRGSNSNAAYQQSLDLFAQQEQKLTQHHRLMTVRARYGDQLVPDKDAIVPGAVNITVPFFEHRLSIGLALTLYSKTISTFITGSDPA